MCYIIWVKGSVIKFWKERLFFVKIRRIFEGKDWVRLWSGIVLDMRGEDDKGEYFKKRDEKLRLREKEVLELFYERVVYFVRLSVLNWKG